MKAGLLAAALLVAVSGPPSAAAESLTVASWGGAYAEACKKAYYEPFTAATGIEIRLDDYSGGLSEIRAQVESGNIHWDVVDFEFSDLVHGCDEGLLELVDIDSLPPAPDGTPAKDDYYEGTRSECGGGGLFWSTHYAYRSEAFPTVQPTTLEDFFDLAKFPGRRSLRRTPYVNMELALMAEGVPADEVYEVLNTAAGINRAFRKLSTIKEHVLWWDVGAQPLQMLASREVAMSTIWNRRSFVAQIVDKQPFTTIWDGQALEHGQLGIVVGTPKLEAAMQFLRFASKVESMAAMSRYISVSPTRRSASELISTHHETGVDMWPHMPNHPRNMRRSVRIDWRWWRDNFDQMMDRFNAWLLR